MKGQFLGITHEGNSLFSQTIDKQMTKQSYPNVASIDVVIFSSS